jgi:hypothetical protein
VGQEAHANALHVHEERKLMVSHMCNGPNVLAGYYKPVLVRARVLGRKRHHQGVLVHELAVTPPARVLAKYASLSLRHLFIRIRRAVRVGFVLDLSQWQLPGSDCRQLKAALRRIARPQYVTACIRAPTHAHGGTGIGPERASEGVFHAAKAAQGRAGRAGQVARRSGEAEGCRGRSDSR